jgi:hypothetical protein
MMSCLAGVLVAQSHEVQASVKRQSNDSYAPVQTATSSKPKPEMERLAFLVGTWTASDTYEKSKFAPEPEDRDGVYRSIPGRILYPARLPLHKSAGGSQADIRF